MLNNLQVWGQNLLFQPGMRLNWSVSRNNWLVCGYIASCVKPASCLLVNLLLHLHLLISFFFFVKHTSFNFLVAVKPGKHAPDEVMILPLDLTSGEDKLREAVQQAESLFSGAGVDYLIHNAAFERPVSPFVFEFIFLWCHFHNEKYI